MTRLSLACLALAAVLWPAGAAHAGSVTITVAQTTNPNVTKSYTIADADIDRIVSAYQTAANVSINGTATKAQVMLYLTNLWMGEITAAVKAYDMDKATKAIVAPTPVNPQ